MDPQRHLIIFMRYPEAGRVKTRLIPAVGGEGAAGIHRQLAGRTVVTSRVAAAAVGASAPIWKGLPSAKPPMLPQAAWDGLTAKPSVFTYETSIYTRADGQQKFIKTTGKYPK